MTLKAAFIFIAPEADPAQHQALVKTPEVEVTTLAVTSYAQAEQVAQELVAAGIVAIELCGGFGAEGVARSNGRSRARQRSAWCVLTVTGVWLQEWRMSCLSKAAGNAAQKTTLGRPLSPGFPRGAGV
jgi:hypothetical protein